MYIDLLGRRLTILITLKNYCIMKNIEKLNIKLLLIPNATAFFGLLFATEAQNLFTVAYCVLIFLFITLLHLIECYRLIGC